MSSVLIGISRGLVSNSGPRSIDPGCSAKLSREPAVENPASRLFGAGQSIKKENVFHEKSCNAAT
jgi:hypothetical protein